MAAAFHQRVVAIIAIDGNDWGGRQALGGKRQMKIA